MNHNDFDFCEDLITPFYHFLKQCNMSTKDPKFAHKQMSIPQEYFTIPKAYLQKSIPMSWACCCNPTVNLGNQYIHQTNTNVSYIDENQFDDLEIPVSNGNSPAHKRNYSSRNTPNMFDKAQLSSVR